MVKALARSFKVMSLSVWSIFIVFFLKLICDQVSFVTTGVRGSLTEVSLGEVRRKLSSREKRETSGGLETMRKEQSVFPFTTLSQRHETGIVKAVPGVFSDFCLCWLRRWSRTTTFGFASATFVGP